MSHENDALNDGRSMRERMLAGDLYIADDPELASESRRAATLLHQFNTSDPSDPDARRGVLRELLGSLGEGAEIRPPMQCDYGYQIHVGARTFINYGAVLLDVGTITIGEDVQVGPNVQLLTPTHPLEPAARRAKWEAAEPITIGNNVWLGGGVIVLPGVSIGENTVVGAGAVVTTDLPANVIAVGNPARVIRQV
jgi:maltose O-acetyltransferase